VNCGDVVTFRALARTSPGSSTRPDTVRWTFATIAPQGFTDKKLMVYVSRNESEALMYGL
jgi:hypothetical protein